MHESQVIRFLSLCGVTAALALLSACAELPFYHQALNVTALHEKGITGRGVRVGVVDDGIYPVVVNGVTNLSFAALAGKVGSGTHGLSVCSIIGSKDFGLAPDCEIWAYNSGSATGQKGMDDTLKGMWWCATNGCRVINMSFGFAPDTHDATLRANFNAELRRIREQTGAILVNGLGNNPLNELNYCPQDSDIPICIGGLDPQKRPASLTNSWRKDFSAFGEGVPAHVSAAGKVENLSGTSFACPMGTALVALLLQQEPTLTQDEVYGIFKSTCERLASERTPDYGWGLLQACEVPADYQRQAAYDVEKALYVPLESVAITNSCCVYTPGDGYYDVTLQVGTAIRLMTVPTPANATDPTIYWYRGNTRYLNPVSKDQVVTAQDEIAVESSITINGMTIPLKEPHRFDTLTYDGLNADYAPIVKLRIHLTTNAVPMSVNDRLGGKPPQVSSFTRDADLLTLGVSDAVKGVLYTPFVCETLAGRFRAAQASMPASDAGMEFALERNPLWPSAFLKVVASECAYAEGDLL